MATGRYLFLVSAIFCCLLALAALDSWAQIGAPTRNGYYTCSYIRAKIAKGDAMGTPKIVIASGSNALAGIDARALAAALGTNFFNFGLSASFGPGFQTFEARKILQRGDAVLMPLEYLAYDYNTPRDSLVDAVYSCGADYLRSLSLREKLFLVLAARPQRMVDSFQFRLRPRKMMQISALAAHDVNDVGQRPGSEFPEHDAGVEAGLAKSSPLAIRMDPSSAGAAAIADFVAWANAHGVTVFATWPNTLWFAQYRNAPVFDQIRDFYHGLGVEVIGAPEDGMFPVSQMGDTIYHLNASGIAARTAKLAQRLKSDAIFHRWQLEKALPDLAALKAIKPRAASAPAGPSTK